MAAGPPTGGLTLVTSGDPDRLTGGNLYNRHVLGSLRAAGLPARQLVLAQRPLLLATLALRASLARRRPSLVIVDSIALEAAAPLVGWIRRRLRARLLALMHMLPSELAPLWRRALLRHAEHRLLAAADRVVAVSPSLRDRLAAGSAAPKRVVVIPPGRDGPPVPTDRTADRGDRRFLCVANWHRSKGIHSLIEATAFVGPSINLDLVGDASDRRYAERIHGSIRRHRLAERVRLLGPLAGRALAERYAAADVFVLPSTSEAFGTVYAEAMSFGLPIIACQVGPLPWLVPPECGILVPPNDSAALAVAMGALAADPELRRQMGEAALRRAEDLPTWRESGDSFSRLVYELLARERRSSRAWHDHDAASSKRPMQHPG